MKAGHCERNRRRPDFGGPYKVHEVEHADKARLKDSPAAPVKRIYERNRWRAKTAWRQGSGCVMQPAFETEQADQRVQSVTRYFTSEADRLLSQISPCSATPVTSNITLADRLRLLCD